MRRMPCILALKLSVVSLSLLMLLSPVFVSAAGDEYAVQFTVPSNKDDVWKFVEMVSDLGYPAYMFTQDLGGGVVHYYAQMGTYADYAVARDAAEKLQKKVRVEYEIVHANTNKAVSEKEAAMLAGQSSATTDSPEAPAEVVGEQQAIAEPAPAPTEAQEPAPAEKPAGDLAAGDRTAGDRTAKDVAAFDAPTPMEAAPAKPAPKPAPQAVAEPEPQPEPQPVQQPERQKAAAPAPQESAPDAMAEQSQTPAAAPVPASSAPTGQSMYLAQLHSFSIKDNALKAAREYDARGYDPVIILLYDDSHTPWYVLSLGYWGDMQSARAAASAFKTCEGRSATINQVDASFLKTRVVPF